MCNNADISNGVLLGQPTEGALVAAALKVDNLNSFFHLLLKIIPNYYCYYFLFFFENINILFTSLSVFKFDLFNSILD